MGKRNRVSKIEHQHRLDTIKGLFARNFSYSQVVRVAMQQWGVSESQAKRYVSEAKKLAYTEAQEDLAIQAAQNRNQLDFLYQQAVLNEQWELATKIALAQQENIRKRRKEAGNVIPQHQSGTISPDELARIHELLGKDGGEQPT